MVSENNNDSNLKTCLDCGQTLGPGRSDRKFCNDICRTAFNNKRRSDIAAEPTPAYQLNDDQRQIERDLAAFEKIYQILLANRVKLFNMYHAYERRVPIADFQRFGLNLKYFTSQHRDDYYDQLFNMCFDYGFYIDENIVYITHSESEIYLN